MKAPIRELRTWLQGHGINPEGFELIIVAPTEGKRVEAKAALLQELSIDEATRFAATCRIGEITVAIESKE